MKKFIHFLILSLPLISLAQSGVMLPNSIDLPKVATLATCTTTEKGRMVFNTTDNKGYYCNGLNWQEMTGGGFTLPYSGSANYNETLFKLTVNGGGTGIWTESPSGVGLYAKSTSNIAVKGESIDGAGVEGRSQTSSGIRGISNFTYGVLGQSSGNSGVHGVGANGISGHANSTSGYGVYGSGVNGRAGYFLGNVIIYSDLKVDEDKGIIQNTNSTQLKHYTRKIVFNNQTLSASGTFLSDVLVLTEFSAKPVVYIGDVEFQSNDYYKVTLSIVSVTENSFRIRFYNTSNDPITFSGTWNIIAIGPK